MLLVLPPTINTGRRRFINGMYKRPTYLSSLPYIGIETNIGVRLISGETVSELSLKASSVKLFVMPEHFIHNRSQSAIQLGLDLHSNFCV